MQPPRSSTTRFRRALALGVGLLTCAPLLSAQPAAPAEAPKRLRVVGGLAALNQYTRIEEPFWGTEFNKLSNGRYRVEIAPQDRAGIRTQEMLSLVQSGVVPLGTMLLSGASAQVPELAAPDLAGLNPDLATLRKNVAAFRPHLTTLLRQRFGIELLAVYTYPAQVVFCNKPFAGLRALSGLRVRIVSPSQTDFIEALGARPTAASLVEILPNLRAGNIDCAITGAMSGNTIGLHEQTTHLHTMAVSWGLSLFVAHGATWAAMAPDLKLLIQRELPRLEERIWLDADRETGAGVACNVGASACSGGRKGQMRLVAASADDDRLRRELFARSVLPRFVERCGAACAETWNRTIGPVSGFEARVR